MFYRAANQKENFNAKAQGRKDAKILKFILLTLRLRGFAPLR
jgi:hypothetical protein